MTVAIIGAGMAGACLSRSLTARGIACVLIDKARGVGGRMAAKRCDWAICDIGAQYFTVTDPRFQQWVDEALHAGVVAPWPFSASVLERGVLRASPDDRPRYVAVPGMNAFVKSLLVDQQLMLNTRVAKASQQNGRWILRDAAGATIGEFSALVSTLPAEQAMSLLGGHSSQLDSIPTGVHAPCWAVALATRGKVSDAVQGVFCDDEVSWLSRQSLKPGRAVAESAVFDDVWMLHFSSEFSEQTADATPQDQATKAFQWLQAMLHNNGCAAELSRVHSLAHFWRYARLSAAYEAGLSASAPQIVIDDDRSLAVIGDWTRGGKVEGAFLSAMDCADWLLSR